MIYRVEYHFNHKPKTVWVLHLRAESEERAIEIIYENLDNVKVTKVERKEGVA